MDNDDRSFGERVAGYRRLQGLTQHGLAQRMHRSVSWVTKMERGERRVDSIRVVSELARALCVPIDLLSHLPAPPSAARTETTAASLRRMLDSSASLRPGGSDAVVARVVDVAARMTALRRHYTSGRDPAGLTTGLVALVTDVESADPSSRDRPRIAAVRADALRLGSLVLRQLGDLAMARIAVDRAMAAAEQSGDTRLVASVAATMSVQLMMQGNGEASATLALDAARYLERRPVKRCPADLAIRAALYLSAAQAAARFRDTGESTRLLNAAAVDVEALHADTEHYCLIAGPTNLAIQRVGILVDLGRPEEAVRLGEALRPRQLGSANHTGYHFLHLAQAHAMLGRDQASLDALTVAHRGSPDLIRHDTQARGLVRDLLRRRRIVDERLRRLALSMRMLESGS